MRKINDSPLGIFDSGVGGLTVLREVLQQLPGEEFIYLGDTGRYPYGPRSAGIVRKFALQNARFLMGFGIKVLIVACNTASSVALDELRRWLAVPILGVIEPGAREAVRKTVNKRVGIIGTVGTIGSGAYHRAIADIDPDIKVFSTSCPLFVSLAEEGWLDGDIVESIVHHYLDEMSEKDIDTLILGCTHYPLLRELIQKVVGENVQVIDSAYALVRELNELLVQENLLARTKESANRYYVTDAPDKFKKIGQKFLGKKLDNVNLIEIDL